MAKRSASVFVTATRTVFSNKTYVAIMIAVSALFWFILNVFDQTLFLSPVLIFYLPSYAILGFAISNITAVLLGMVIAINIHILRNMKSGPSVSFFSGPVIGIVPSACASCTSLGFFLVSFFGIAGVATSTFLTNYGIPLRLVAIGILAFAYYSASRKLATSCTIGIPKKDNLPEW